MPTPSPFGRAARLGALGAALLWACGSPPLALPPLLAAAEPGAPASAAEARRAAVQALRARPIGGSGLACADCHRVHPLDPPRPAPPLLDDLAGRVLWRGQAQDAPDAIARCRARYQARQPLSQQARAAMVAAFGQAAAPGSPPADPYDALCRHCHEDGPAPALLGRPWPDDVLTARLRGPMGPSSPDRFMPRFTLSVLSDTTLADVRERLHEAQRHASGQRQR